MPPTKKFTNKQSTKQGKKGHPFKSGIKKSHHQHKPINKKGRVVIRNISFKATEDNIRNHFIKYGQIREVNLLLRPDGNPVGCCFVQFDKEVDAELAIKNCSGKDFMGRNISVELALQQDHYIVSRPTPPENERKVDEPAIKCRVVEFRDDGEASEIKMENDEDGINIAQAEKKKRKKENPLGKDKKGRIIVRNLPFKITEDGLRKHLSAYGELSDVSLLRKPNGLLVGCGFVQFKDKKNAAKAIIECSGKPLLGRPIVLDWAVQKSLYQAKNKPKDDIKIKEEPMDDTEEVDLDVTQSMKLVSDEEDEEEDDEEDEEEDDEEDEEEDDEINEEYIIKKEDETESRRPRIISNDVTEGRTVFLKNVPFSATNDELQECVEQFGPVFYALICVDRMTEHSRGTAFVKFKTTESAEQCLCAGTEFTLNGQVLDPHRALNRDQVNAKASIKADKKSSKDSRNLFLVKEGVILAGSPAAVGVSVTDMSKRLQLEQWKTQMLRNLNMYIARDRLAVHNVPPSFDDKKLKDLFQKHAGANAVITEARVMRDMRNVDINGVGTSKETGFVKFTTHEDALQALRTINNNPSIFSKAKRPIVAFSIENRAIHKVRQLREQKSRAKNPTYANQSLNQDMNDVSVPRPPKKTFSKVLSRKEKRSKQQPSVVSESKEYSGVISEPGNTRLRTKFNLRNQAAMHTETVRKDKNKIKSKRKFIQQKEIRKEQIKLPKQKKGKKKSTADDASFNNLVNKYVTKIANSTMGNKWYDK